MVNLDERVTARLASVNFEHQPSQIGGYQRSVEVPYLEEFLALREQNSVGVPLTVLSASRVNRYRLGEPELVPSKLFDLFVA